MNMSTHTSPRIGDSPPHRPEFACGNAIPTPTALAALQPSRLSTTRLLIEQMRQERWRITVAKFDLDSVGAGEAVYRVDTGRGVMDLVIFAKEPKRDGRTSRIIGGTWDLTAALIEGPVTEAQISLTREEMPKLYEGRGCEGTLVWCRSNRSLRVFDYVVAALASGRQPSAAALTHVGYLLRNTGLDANGTFGTKPFFAYEERHPLAAPFFPQMLTAYLVRQFSIDLADHLAAAASPETAVRMDRNIARSIGLGNGSGLGLILWATNHPRFIDNWLSVRARALDAARSALLTAEHLPDLESRLRDAQGFRAQDPMRYHIIRSSAEIANDLESILQTMAVIVAEGRSLSGEELLQRLPIVCPEALDCVAMAILDSMPDLVSFDWRDLVVDEEAAFDATMSVATLRRLTEQVYEWLDEWPSDPRDRPYVWYRSIAGEEPRRGLRHEVPEGTFDLSVDLMAEREELRAACATQPPDATVGSLVRSHPRLRRSATRVQVASDLTFGPLRMDMKSADFHPSQIIAFINVAVFGLARARDALDRNILGVMYLGAPLRDELATTHDWWTPAVPFASAEWRPLTFTGQQ